MVKKLDFNGMQKASCFIKVLGRERLRTLQTQREQEGILKNVFFNFIMVYLYSQKKAVTEVEAIRAFYAKYGLEESDWEEDSAVKCWRRYKKRVLSGSAILSKKIKRKRKVLHSSQFIPQMLSLFADTHF
jgi:hypothetical protein